jgi:hypothetical protein
MASALVGWHGAAIRAPKRFPLLRAPKLLKTAVANSAFVAKSAISGQFRQYTQRLAAPLT